MKLNIQYSSIVGARLALEYHSHIMHRIVHVNPGFTHMTRVRSLSPLALVGVPARPLPDLCSSLSRGPRAINDRKSRTIYDSVRCNLGPTETRSHLAPWPLTSEVPAELCASQSRMTASLSMSRCLMDGEDNEGFLYAEDGGGVEYQWEGFS